MVEGIRIKSHNDMWKENIRTNRKVKSGGIIINRKSKEVKMEWEDFKKEPQVLGFRNKQRKHSASFKFGPRKGETKTGIKGFDLLEEKWAKDNPEPPRFVRKKLSKKEDRLRLSIAKEKGELIVDERFDKNCNHEFVHRSNRLKVECLHCGLKGDKGELETALGEVILSKKDTRKRFKSGLDEEGKPFKVFQTWKDMKKADWPVPENYKELPEMATWLYKKLQAKAKELEGEVGSVKSYEGQRTDQGKQTRKPVERTGRRDK